MLLPLDPVDQRLEPADGVDVGLARRIAEGQLFVLSLLEDVGVLLEDLLVGEVLADTGVDLVQDPELDGALVVDLDEPGSLDGALQSTGEDGQVFPLLFVLYQLLQGNGQCVGVPFSLFRQLGVASDPIFDVVLALSMPR